MLKTGWPSLLAISLCALPAWSAENAPRGVDFDREIRPIFSDKCFTCHGPDGAKRMANLRLDMADGGAYSTRGKYKIITPGDSAKSRLFERVSAANQARRMPPASAGKGLTPQQVELIKQWIDQGAKWEQHWAFVPPKAAEAPAVKDRAWVRNRIDDFVLARLEKEGLKPSPEADRATLLRRVSYDLTGLPPTLAELNSFLADRAPDAYERRVDQLLQSPRYGERMAMQWMDLARYADTHGYHIDSQRDMWLWRNWLINAFNSNMHYDQFTIEQLAGDLLPNATTSQRIASGFNRNHMINFEGGAIPEEYQVEYVVDRVEATSTTWMGLTMGCARCHDHKYDPIKQKEFYQFFAFFNNVSEKGLDGREGNAVPLLPVPSAEQQTRQTQLKQEIAVREKALGEADVLARQRAWEQTLLQQPPTKPQGLWAHYPLDGSLADISGNYRTARAVKGDLTYSKGAVDRAADFDGETQVTFGHAPMFEREKPFAVSAWIRANGKEREALLQQIGDAAARRGFEIYLDDFVLTGIQQRSPLVYIRLTNQWPQAAIEVRTRDHVVYRDAPRLITVNYDGSGKAAGFRVYLDGQPMPLETLKDTLTGSASSMADLSIGNKDWGLPYRGKLDDLRIYERQLDAPEIAELAQQEPLRAIVNTLPAKRSKEQNEWIRNYYLSNAAPAPERTSWAELKTFRDQEKQLERAIPTTMVMDEEKDKPRDTFILLRGDYRNHGEKVTPGVPAVLPPLPKDQPANRLTLAKWLVDPSNPLTARVAVNRYWQGYFGTGLVKTAENFGSQGEAPSHPELLDWLATEFVRSGWDMRAMQRLIVTSATYRQASRVTPELEKRDPENRLLARGPRFRLPAEMIRDGALYESGLLKEKVGGPGVRPYQPKGLWREIAFGDGFSAQAYQQGHGDDLYRRSMYTFWKRTSPPPEMITFDAPDREKCSARRLQTNTPLQALVLLNDTTYIEAARALARRMLTEGGSNVEKRIGYGFRLATARQPAPKEVAVLRTALTQSMQDFRGHDDRAASLLNVGEARFDSKVSKADMAAWTTVASMILNLDETITKE